jgi:hypothetical protein
MHASKEALESLVVALAAKLVRDYLAEKSALDQQDNPACSKRASLQPMDKAA